MRRTTELCDHVMILDKFDLALFIPKGYNPPNPKVIMERVLWVFLGLIQVGGIISSLNSILNRTKLTLKCLEELDFRKIKGEEIMLIDLGPRCLELNQLFPRYSYLLSFWVSFRVTNPRSKLAEWKKETAANNGGRRSDSKTPAKSNKDVVRLSRQLPQLSLQNAVALGFLSMSEMHPFDPPLFLIHSLTQESQRISSASPQQETKAMSPTSMGLCMSVKIHPH